jgi:uncharacterized protein YcfL
MWIAAAAPLLHYAALRAGIAGSVLKCDRQTPAFTHYRILWYTTPKL